MMWGWGYGGWGHGLGWMGPVLTVAFWAAIITGGVFLIRSMVRRGSPGTREESALETLRQRYARGEIDKREYEEKRKDLS
jgi:putative membrane protein